MILLLWMRMPDMKIKWWLKWEFHEKVEQLYDLLFKSNFEISLGLLNVKLKEEDTLK
jgi:hypothetical protein